MGFVVVPADQHKRSNFISCENIIISVYESNSIHLEYSLFLLAFRIFILALLLYKKSPDITIIFAVVSRGRQRPTIL